MIQSGTGLGVVVHQGLFKVSYIILGVRISDESFSLKYSKTI